MAPGGEKNGHSDARTPAQVHLPTAVANLGKTQYPDAYGGLTARLTRPDEPASLTMTIYVVAARADPFLAAVRRQAAASPDTRYTIAHVPHTWAELNALAQQIEDAKDHWRARGAHVSTAEPDAAASKVTVTLLPFRPGTQMGQERLPRHAPPTRAPAGQQISHNKAAASALTAAYGHDWISVVVVPSSARYVPLGKKARRSGGTYTTAPSRRPW